MIAEDERYLPGQGGLVDCRAIMQHLKAEGYEGPVSLVPAPARFAGMTRDAIVQQTKAMFEDLLNPTPPLDGEVAESEYGNLGDEGETEETAQLSATSSDVDSD